MTEKDQGDIWFVYDGECPICRTAARAFAVREAVGRLHTINARTEKMHPIVQQVKTAGLNLDEGMVVSYGGKLYHGKDALHLMALIKPHPLEEKVGNIVINHTTNSLTAKPKDYSLLLK